MAKEQKGFVVYGDSSEIVNKLSDEDAGKLFKSMFDYFLTGNEPEFDGKLDMAFVMMRQIMDHNTDKYKKRCEKNRENVKKRYERIRSNTNEYDGIRSYTNATNINIDIDKNIDIDRNIESVPDASSLSSSLIKHLNEKTGSGYSVDAATINRVQGLIDSGYTQDQMRTVIDKKCADWLGDEKMRGYLRPSTLFGDKFPEYLAAPVSLAQEREQDTEKKRRSLSAELKQKRETLGVLRASLDEIPRGTRMDERRTLKEQIAALEDSIGIIERRLS